MIVLRYALPFVVVWSLGATGCFSPYLKRDPAAPEPNPSEAMVGGFVVRFQDSGKEKSAVEAVVSAAQNAGLAEFGQKAALLHAQALSRFGYTAKFDGARAKRLDLIQFDSNAITAALTGSWRHPDSSSWGPLMVDTLFVKPVDVVAKLKDDNQKEYFAFTEIVIVETGLFLKEPTVMLRTAIFDVSGRKVLDLGAMGAGAANLLFCDRSPKNLEAALDAAFKGLTIVKEEKL